MRTQKKKKSFSFTKHLLCLAAGEREEPVRGSDSSEMRIKSGMSKEVSEVGQV